MKKLLIIILLLSSYVCFGQAETNLMTIWYDKMETYTNKNGKLTLVHTSNESSFVLLRTEQVLWDVEDKVLEHDIIEVEGDEKSEVITFKLKTPSGKYCQMIVDENNSVVYFKYTAIGENTTFKLNIAKIYYHK